MKSAVFLKSTIHNTPQNLLNGSSMVSQCVFIAHEALIYSTFFPLPSHDHRITIARPSHYHRITIARPSHDHRTTIARPSHVHLPHKYVLITCKIRVHLMSTQCIPCTKKRKIAPKKSHFIFFLQNIWSCQKKVVILHAIYRILRRRFFDYTRLFTKYLHL